MAKFIIEEIASEQDLIAIAHRLLDAVVSGEGRRFTEPGTMHMWTTHDEPLRIDDFELEWMVTFGEEYACLNDDHSPHCTCLCAAAATDVRQRPLFETERTTGRVQYQPCPEQGTHRSLEECWRCWSDVERGVITRDEALAPEEVRG